MRSLLIFLSLFIGPAALAGEPRGGEEQWIPLFNGKNLEGWTPKFAGFELGNNYRDTFTVQDGLLTVDYSGWDEFKGEFGHLFYKDTFSHYRLRAEYRFIGDQVTKGPGWAKRNNGLMIHGQSAESMGKNQKFPACLEVQLLGGIGNGPRPTGNLIMCGGLRCLIEGEPNKQRITDSSSPTFDGDQWVTIELEVRGPDVKVFINGEKVIACTELKNRDGSLRDEGTISIQAETHPVQYRKIELLPLAPPDGG